MYGIYVSENGRIWYAQAIAKGLKPIETRNRNMLKSLIGERVAIVRTRSGEYPMIIGYATITGSKFHTREELDTMRDKTLIPPGSKYDCQGKGKWCYYMAEAEQCKPHPLPENKINHGRSYCEFWEEETCTQ